MVLQFRELPATDVSPDHAGHQGVHPNIPARQEILHTVLYLLREPRHRYRNVLFLC